MRPFIRHITCACLLGLIGIPQSSADEVQAADESRAIIVNHPRKIERPPQVFRGAILPAGEPSPALKHRIYPTRFELQPGNSVPYYYRAILGFTAFPEQTHTDFYALMDELHEKPLSTYAELKAREKFDKFAFGNLLGDLEKATTRETTNWDWQLNQVTGFESIAFRLEEIQQARGLARILTVRASIYASEGDFEAALRDIKMMLKLARDVAEPPILINELVGVAISSMAIYDLKEFILQTDCPNLYWALAALPDPMIDMREAMEHEAGLIDMMFPMLANPESTDHTPEEWARLHREACKVAFQLEEEVSDPLQNHLFATALAMRGYPMANRELLKSGMDPQKLQGMSVGQTVAVYQKRVSRHMYDEVFKWEYLPYPDSRPRGNESEARLIREGWLGPGLRREAIPMAAVLLPAVRQARRAQYRLQSNIRGLMALEAIRMHAAENGGALPKTLDEITVVPVPINPMNNKPFDYRWDGNEAVLIIENDPNIPSVWWEIRLTTR